MGGGEIVSRNYFVTGGSRSALGIGNEQVLSKWGKKKKLGTGLPAQLGNGTGPANFRTGSRRSEREIEGMVGRYR